MWDERIRRETLQSGLHRTQHYAVYEKRSLDNTSCLTLIPSFRALRKERLGPLPPFWRPRMACILRLRISYGSPVEQKNAVLFKSDMILFHRDTKNEMCWSYQTLSPARRTFVFLGSRCTRPLNLRDAHPCSLLRIFKMADRLKREIKKAKRFCNKYLT